MLRLACCAASWAAPDCAFGLAQLGHVDAETEQGNLAFFQGAMVPGDAALVA
ncbi:hypothetical protein [Massilia eburnea]|uniref:hypothetical protein n=1 Tax=Massilia eburnea TaxID=1776165 RepID=UPI003D6C5374